MISDNRLTDREFENVLSATPKSELSAHVRGLIVELFERVKALEAEISELRREPAEDAGIMGGDAGGVFTDRDGNPV